MSEGDSETAHDALRPQRDAGMVNPTPNPTPSLRAVCCCGLPSVHSPVDQRDPRTEGPQDRDLEKERS